MQDHNQEIQYTYAGFWMRFAAYAVDGIIVFAGIAIIHAVLTAGAAFLKDTFLSGEILFHYTITDIIEYVCEAAYFVIFTYSTGSTLGKKLLKLKVISLKETEKPGILDVIYRETVGRYLSMISLGIGYLMAGVDKEKRALHDVLCDTRVVQVHKVMQKKAEEPAAEQAPRIEPEKVQEMVEEQWKKILCPQDEEKIEGDS